MTRICAHAVLIAMSLGLLTLAGCGGFIKPGTPGHEPPSADNYNPVSREINGP